MHKRIVSEAVSIILLISMFSSAFNIKFVKAETYPNGRYYLVPSNNVFYADETNVGTRFNVTFWAFNLSRCYAYQFRVYADSSMLNITRAWLPQWDPSWVFYGYSTWAFTPVIGEDLNGYYAAVADQLFPVPLEINATGIMGIVEFSIAAKPLHGTLSSQLNITNNQSFWMDTAPTIYYPEQENGYYEMAYVQQHGPRMSNLLVKYYSDRTAAYNALVAGEIDLFDMELTEAQMYEVFNNTNIYASISPAPLLFEFDINNNETIPTYRTWTSPTAYKSFRQAIAFLVDKDYIVDNIVPYSYRVDTPFTRPFQDWWVNWELSQYDSYGNLLGNYLYEYSPNFAAAYLNSSGFLQGNTTNPYNDPAFPYSAQYLRTYPPSHPKQGQNLDPLIFYIRNDDPRRLAAGRILRDNLRKMGIPVNATEAPRSTCITEVLWQRDYHIYTGGWYFGLISNALSIYASQYIGSGDYNYVQFRNATYDDLARTADSPANLTIAKQAALGAQRILVEEAASIWLWSPSYVMGYRNLYGVTNARGEFISNQWTFLNARKVTNATGDVQINFGLYLAPNSLNVVTDYSISGISIVKDALQPIYDTLLSRNPYDKTPGNTQGNGDRGGLMPWMAQDWELGEWESPYEPCKNLTKLTFYLRDGLSWHDGVTLNSTDIKFTIDYLKGLGSSTSLANAVSTVHHVTTPDARTVFVYENVSNIWTLDYIGMLPILPKHIFQNITDVTGYTPGANEGHPASETLIGSGPWKYVFHNDSMLYLEANRLYFMETPPEAEIDYRYNWERGSWAVDTMDATMISEAWSAQGSGVPSAKWEPGVDIGRGDGIVNIFDLVIVGQGFNTTWGKSARREIVSPPTATALYVEHSANPIVVGQNVTVYVKLRNATKLSGFEFKLSYDNAKLDFRSLTLTPVFGGSSYEWKKVVNETIGRVWASVSMLQTGMEFSGNTTLATMVFTAIQPSGSILDLWNTELAVFGAPGLTCQPMAHVTFDKGVMVGVSTPSGTNVQVTPATNVNVTFAETTTEGVTTLNVTQAPSPEFLSVLVYDIETTATYTGNITIQFAYDDTGLSLEDEQAMKIWLWNNTSQSWVDVTTSVDTVNNIVYGVTPHLSMFGITSNIWLGDSFSGEGSFTVRTPTTPPTAPLPGLAWLAYYDISTTRTYTPPITLRIAYDGSNVPPHLESFVKIWIWEELFTTWVDITTSVDAASDHIYGEAPHLSMFGITSFEGLPSGIVVGGASSVSKTVVGQGYAVDVDVAVVNQGPPDITQSFTVHVYANDTIIGTESISNLAPSGQASFSFTWSTAGWAKGRYAISVGDHLIAWVAVTIAGDVTGDFFVNIVDATQIGLYWIKPVPPTPPNVDITGDGMVNIADATQVGLHWQQHA